MASIAAAVASAPSFYIIDRISRFTGKNQSSICVGMAAAAAIIHHFLAGKIWELQPLANFPDSAGAMGFGFGGLFPAACPSLFSARVHKSSQF